MRVDSYNPRKAKDEAHAVLFIYTDKRAYVAEGTRLLPEWPKSYQLPYLVEGITICERETRLWGDAICLSRTIHTCVLTIHPMYAPSSLTSNSNL